ncbi:MAG: hypothetical protein FJ118_13460 [Deltaproteobacteria bacterium]|nr:hypothetical protein [Deltaproteobacteria bacterium]
MEANLILGSALLAIACVIGAVMMLGWLAAMRSREQPRTRMRARPAAQLEAAQCVYDCLIWFHKRPDLVGHCSRACGMAKK